MADPKDSEQGFLRKVARFVANPATDWADLGSRPALSREERAEQSELKAMVERKRRNDFVRKREFDMLRRLRREGLTSEQLAALGSSSGMDDSDLRRSDPSQREQQSVKAKIDDIERQMVGDTEAQRSRASQGFAPSSTQQRAGSASAAAGRSDLLPPLPPALAAGLQTDNPAGLQISTTALTAPLTTIPMPPPAAMAASGSQPDLSAPRLPQAAEPSGLAPLPQLEPLTAPQATMPLDIEVNIQVNELAHDPDLDEAVMAFANADYAQAESTLLQLTTPTGPRARHAETWLVLFDLYRAIGQQERFETLANDFAFQFGTSAPQWVSLPRLVADALAKEGPKASRQVGAAGWFCPGLIDEPAVAHLRDAALQMPLPWVLDWAPLSTVEPEGARALVALFRGWASQRIDMQWLSADRLLSVLFRAGPTGDAKADPAFWLARMEAMRLANRPDQFDEVAIDYCVTYEVSPPAWEPARCTLNLVGSELSSQTAGVSRLSGLPGHFHESVLADGAGHEDVGSVELSGQFVGDQSESLRGLDSGLAGAKVIQVSCERLVRVDFVAAGDLLNWVITKHRQGKSVQFVGAHRVVALFFGAMGITEHAKVRVRSV